MADKRMVYLLRTNLARFNEIRDSFPDLPPNLRQADLRVQGLPGAHLFGAKMFGADLSGSGLYRADLSSAELRQANLSGADLREATLASSDLRRANLQMTDLRGANLAGADLRGADLRSAKLIGADLVGANLMGANLSRSNLTEADLTGADVTDVLAFGVKWAPERPVTWPEGFDVPVNLLGKGPGADGSRSLVGGFPAWQLAEAKANAEAEAEARRRREVEKVEEQKGCLMLGALPCLIIMVVAYFSEDLDWGSAFVLSGVIALFTIIYGLK
jgi:hypothetical protein